jgi:hypothetical protein
MLTVLAVAIWPLIGAVPAPAPPAWYACTGGEYLAIDDGGKTAWRYEPSRPPVQLTGASVSPDSLIARDFTLHRATGKFADIGTGEAGLCWRTSTPPVHRALNG